MVFIMPVCVRCNRSIIRFFILLLLLQAGFSQAENLKPASGFNVVNTTVYEKDKSFYLDANIEYWFSSQVLEALNNGVPLNIVVEIQIIEQRKFLWNRIVVDLSQYYQIQYHALTRQYVLRDLNSGKNYNFLTLQLTLSSLGSISQLPLFVTTQIDTDLDFQIRIKPYLDIEALPSPLRPVAYLSPDWQLTGKWYSWPLTN